MSDLKPCPFCGGSVERIEPGGQLWRGQGYSDPQFWTLRHFGKLSETDAFPTCTIQIRERTEGAAIAAWNRRAAHARIEAQAALIAELTRELRHAIETYEGEYAYPAPDGWTVALARAEEAQK